AVTNELLRHEIDGIKEALFIKKKRSKPANTLPIADDEEYYGGAIFWSPRRIERSFILREAQQQESEAKAARKAQEKEQQQLQRLLRQKEAEEKCQKRQETIAANAAKRAQKRLEITTKKEALAARKAAREAEMAERRIQTTSAPKTRRKSHTNKVAQRPDNGGGAQGPSQRSTRRGRAI
ncbi:hypothetical protein DM02DRAFT_620552, partial [Periconia macrospinosa]